MPTEKILFLGFCGLFLVVCVIVAVIHVPKELRHRAFQERFDAYYPNAQVVEVYHCANVIKRDGKFLRVTLNEEDKFVEKPYFPFTETAPA